MLNMQFVIYIFVGIIAYLIGSISPAILISKSQNKDILNEGSKNAGATNAVRVLGLKLGLCVFALDVFKGFIVTFLAVFLLGLAYGYIASFALVVGHVFSCFHHFKAGKGVAPTIGVVLAVC